MNTDLFPVALSKQNKGFLFDI